MAKREVSSTKNLKEYENKVKKDFRLIPAEKEKIVDIDIIDAGNEYNKIYIANTNILRQCIWVASGLKCF